MDMGLPTRNHCTTQRPRPLVVSVPRSAALVPRRIAQGVFFVNSDRDIETDENGNDSVLSPTTLVNLEITHAVVKRGTDPYLSCGVKSLFVSSQDPLSKIVAWMRAVRRLGAHIIVGDFAAAAGYLVVELGITPRTAWLRIARGVPPIGDLVLARLCVLALVHNEKEKENRSVDGNKAGLGLSERERERISGNGDVSGGTRCGRQGLGIPPRSHRKQWFGTRAGSGLKYVVAN